MVQSVSNLKGWKVAPVVMNKENALKQKPKIRIPNQLAYIGNTAGVINVLQPQKVIKLNGAIY